MIVLSIDTCDSRGSVALLRDESVLGLIPHETRDEYSSWLLPAVKDLLKKAGLPMKDVSGYAVAAGPGSFTGVRVGLTTVKAWAEVYGKPVAAISRLESIAAQATVPSGCLAAFVDAQRGQVFGAVYEKERDTLVRLAEEMVIAPGRFVETAAELTTFTRNIRQPCSANSRAAGPAVVVMRCDPSALAWSWMFTPATTDALGLDANYVRRSDAEIFWKGAAHGH